MDDVRRVRRAMKLAAGVAVLGGLLALTLGDWDLVALFAVGIGVAGVVYWLAPRYPVLFETDGDTDPGSRRRLVVSLFDLATFLVATIGLAYGWARLGWTGVFVLTAPPEGTPVGLSAVLVGVLLGAVVPLLAEHEVAFHRFQGPVQGETASQVFRMGFVVLFLIAVPGALLGFLGAFVAGRLGVLFWWQTTA